jgi:hypothetical protein
MGKQKHSLLLVSFWHRPASLLSICGASLLPVTEPRSGFLDKLEQRAHLMLDGWFQFHMLAARIFTINSSLGGKQKCKSHGYKQFRLCHAQRTIVTLGGFAPALKSEKWKSENCENIFSFFPNRTELAFLCSAVETLWQPTGNQRCFSLARTGLHVDFYCMSYPPKSC